MRRSAARLIALLLGACLLGACTPTYKALREANRENLYRLQIGMSRGEVARIMGEQGAQMTHVVPLWGEIIDNPMRRETLRGPRGDRLEVDYYYTGHDSDGPTAATPVVFADGRVVGVGRAFLAGRRGLLGYR